MSKSVVSASPSFGIRASGFPNQTTKEEIEKLFSQVGNVKNVELIQRSDNCEAHIFYTTEKHMREACDLFHQTTVKGREISATMLVSKMALKDLHDVFIIGHPRKATNAELRKLFKSICNVDAIRVTNKGDYCFLQVFGMDACNEAVEKLNGVVLKTGERLSCQISKTKEKALLGAKELQLSTILHNICKANSILPLLSVSDMFILEKSLRTFHLSSIPLDTLESEITSHFDEYGEIQNCQLIVKDTFNTAFGFLVFKSHSSSSEFRKNGAMRIFINNKTIKIAASNPTRAVTDTARTAGLLDYRNNPTNLLHDLMALGLQRLEGRKKQVKVALLQDPITGEVIPWQTTEEEFQEYCAKSACKTWQQQQPLYQMAQSLMIPQQAQYGHMNILGVRVQNIQLSPQKYTKPLTQYTTGFSPY